ncbi:MAG: DNA polymerase III subunit beta [Bacteroidia bacterium]
MAFRVYSEEFLKALEKVVPMVAQRSTYPALQNVFISQQSDKVEIRATDLDAHIQVFLKVEPEQDVGVSLCLPPKTLIDLLRNVDTQVLVQKKEENTIEISYAEVQGLYTVAGIPAEEFPPFQVPNSSQRVSLRWGVFKKAAQKVLYAVSKDESRPAMRAVCMDIDPAKVAFVGTDGHILSLLEQHISIGSEKVRLLIPDKAFNYFETAFKQHPEETLLDLYYTPSQVYLLGGDVSIVARQVDATYPDYRAVIPTHSSKEAHISRKLLLSTLRRLSVFANKSLDSARFSFSGNTVMISTQDYERGTSAQEEMPCSYEGEDFQISIRLRLLIEVLNHFDSDELIFQMETPGRAIRIEPDPHLPHEHHTVLVMPVIS